jgi:F0F1-type ATP synthase delta subunit
MEGKLYTAYPMDGETVAGIEKQFTEKLETPVSLKMEVDNSLIAGFVVQVGFLRFDYSARARLREMMNHMLGDA